MRLLDLSEDILLSLIHHLEVQCILSVRQTCRCFNELTRYRSVWLVACTRSVLDKGLPFPYKSLGGVSASEIESLTRRALSLNVSWSRKDRTPHRTFSFTGGPLNGLRAVRFVLKREYEWIITVSEGVWPVISCWDLNLFHSGSPRMAGEWSCKGAIIKDIAVDPSPISDACIAVSIDNYSQQKRYIEIQRIRPISDNRQVGFETINTLYIDSSPVLLEGDILVADDEYTQARIINWRTGECAILEGSGGPDDVIQHNKCSQVLFAGGGIFVARSRSIDLFPDAKLRPADETMQPIQPLKTYSFGWISGIAIAPIWKHDRDYPREAVCAIIRMEGEDPWESDIDSLKYFVFPRIDGPDVDSSLYRFPPVHLASIFSGKKRMHGNPLALGPSGTCLFVGVQAGNGGVRRQYLWSTTWLGPMGDGGVDEVDGGCSELFSTGGGRSLWTSMDYVESRGCIALGAVDGSVTVLFLVE